MLSVKGHVTNVLPLSEEIFMLLQPVMQQNVALHIARQVELSSTLHNFGRHVAA